jgi:hypothetical protein
MGRIVDLLGEVAAAADEGHDGMVLDVEDRERLRDDWDDDDIDDALALVNQSYLNQAVVEIVDNLSSRLVETLGRYGAEDAFQEMVKKGATLDVAQVVHLVRVVGHVEDMLIDLRDDAPPDRSGFDELARRLKDLGIEREMLAGRRLEEKQADDDEDGPDEE